jgi:hypothetical protein
MRDCDGNPVKVFYGHQAIAEVERLENRKLSPIECRVVVEEGFVPEVYRDTKGVLTYGVGQTGKYINMGFKASFEAHVEKAKKMIKGYETFPEYLQEELIQCCYRGDLGMSPKTVKYINRGEYIAASEEFLDNAEFRSIKTPVSIKQRMKGLADALRQYAREIHGWS